MTTMQEIIAIILYVITIICFLLNILTIRVSDQFDTNDLVIDFQMTCRSMILGKNLFWLFIYCNKNLLWFTIFGIFF